MRRLLRDVAEGRDLGDTTTLADPTVVSEIQRRAAEAPPRMTHQPMGETGPYGPVCPSVGGWG